MNRTLNLDIHLSRNIGTRFLKTLTEKKLAKKFRYSIKWVLYKRIKQHQILNT